MPNIEKLQKAIPTHKHDQQYSGEWDWIGSHIGCCDCGLVHKLDYRVVDLATEKAIEYKEFVEKGGFGIQFRSFRDENLTLQARLSQNFTCKIPQGGGEK